MEVCCSFAVTLESRRDQNRDERGNAVKIYAPEATLSGLRIGVMDNAKRLDITAKVIQSDPVAFGRAGRRG